MSLHGKNIVITGASRGFGNFLACRLWQQGANLALVTRKNMVFDHKPVVDKQRMCIICADLLYPHQATSRILENTEWMGEIHGLINNAAVQGPVGKAVETHWKDYEDTLSVNLLSPILLSRAFAMIMGGNGGGKIINMSGGGASRARPNFSAYAASKTALVRFSETLAEECKDIHVDVNCVAPGALLTDMTKDQDMQGLTQEVSEKRMGDAAELIMFLLSDKSDGITGRLISAQHDPWRDILKYKEALINSEIWTLRRITPADRGLDWSSCE